MAGDAQGGTKKVSQRKLRLLLNALRVLYPAASVRSGHYFATIYDGLYLIRLTHAEMAQVRTHISGFRRCWQSMLSNLSIVMCHFRSLQLVLNVVFFVRKMHQMHRLGGLTPHPTKAKSRLRVRRTQQLVSAVDRSLSVSRKINARHQ